MENMYAGVFQGEVTHAMRSHNGWALSDADGPDPLNEVRAALVDALERVDTLINHRHEWDHNDYCYICHADGRA